MDEIYREYILEHYKHPHNFGELEQSRPRVRGHEPALRRRAARPAALDDDGRIEQSRSPGRAARSARRRRRWSPTRSRGCRRGAARARQGLRARPARDRHLGDADEVRAAVAEGPQERRASGAAAEWEDSDYRPGGAVNGAGSEPRSHSRRPGSGRPPGRTLDQKSDWMGRSYCDFGRDDRRLPSERAAAWRQCGSLNGRTSRSASSTAPARSTRSRIAARMTTDRSSRASSTRQTCTIECPRHGSLFDLTTGSAEDASRLPARGDLSGRHRRRHDQAGG